MRAFLERDTDMNRTTHGGSERVVMLQTKFTELLGCTVPIQQAGMGKLASPALAAAVADAGGLGMVSGIAAAPPEYVAKILDRLRRSTSGAFGANFIVAGARESGKLDADFLKVLEVAASRAPVVEFFYEQPDPELVEIAHAGGALVSWQVGSGPEAVAAERTGCGPIASCGPAWTRSNGSTGSSSARPHSRGLRMFAFPYKRAPRSSPTRRRPGRSTRCRCGPGSPWMA